jgi:hypothetical protein
MWWPLRRAPPKPEPDTRTPREHLLDDVARLSALILRHYPPEVREAAFRWAYCERPRPCCWPELARRIHWKARELTVAANEGAT